MFTEKKDDGPLMFTAVEEGLITPPPSVIEDSAFATYLPFQGVMHLRAKWFASWIWRLRWTVYELKGIQKEDSLEGGYVKSEWEIRWGI
jgi:hypothetical protein